jgi:pimeloyl-ACP methyl ester carboxylesterase
MTTTQWTAETRGAGQYADVNGIKLYYETRGSGRPLVLLHGGLGSGEMFGPILPALAANHEVIAVDLQGHGRTADIDRPIDIRLMADDIAALIDHLGLDKPDVLGYSLGGGVAFFLASKYPGKVGRLVMVSANIRRDAIPPEMLAQQGQVSAAAAEFMKDTPMYQLYQRVAPRPEDFGRLLDKIGASMAKDFDYSAEVRGLKVPTLIVAADADMAPPSHYVETFKLLDGGLRDGGWMGEGRPKGGHALAILPGLTHYNMASSPLVAAVALNFIDAPDAPQAPS